MAKKPKRFCPVPAAASGAGPWIVEEDKSKRGMVSVRKDGTGGRMRVPLDDSPASVAIRTHEYVHLQLSHLFKKRLESYEEMLEEASVPDMWNQVILDAVVNGYTAQAGLPLQDLPVGGGTSLSKVDPGTQDAAALAATCVQLSNTAHYAKAQALLERKLGTSAEARRKLASVRKTADEAFGYGRKAYDIGTLVPASYLADLAVKMNLLFLEEPDEEEKESTTISSSPGDVPAPKYTDDILSRMTMDAALRRAGFGGERGAIGKLLKAKSGSEIEEIMASAHDKMDNHWGIMAITTARPMNRHAARRSFRHRPSFTGAFRYPHRALSLSSDGRAWHSKGVGLSGTLLLDASGSMSLSVAYIQKLLAESPLATIAIYSGGLRTNDRGTLTILARENRYASTWASDGGGNIVDGPALRWLGRQPRPRVWISDGVVTGVGDQPTAILTIEARALVKVHDIAIYPNIAAYLHAKGMLRHQRPA